MAEEMERHFGAQQIGKGRVGGIGVTAAGNALVAQVIEGIPCQQVFVIPQAQTSGCRGIDAQNQLADFGIGFALGLSLAVLRIPLLSYSNYYPLLTNFLKLVLQLT